MIVTVRYPLKHLKQVVYILYNNKRCFMSLQFKSLTLGEPTNFRFSLYMIRTQLELEFFKF